MALEPAEYEKLIGTLNNLDGTVSSLGKNIEKLMGSFNNNVKSTQKLNNHLKNSNANASKMSKTVSVLTKVTVALSSSFTLLNTTIGGAFQQGAKYNKQLFEGVRAAQLYGESHKGAVAGLKEMGKAVGLNEKTAASFYKTYMSMANGAVPSTRQMAKVVKILGDEFGKTAEDINGATAKFAKLQSMQIGIDDKFLVDLRNGLVSNVELLEKFEKIRLLGGGEEHIEFLKRVGTGTEKATDEFKSMSDLIAHIGDSIDKMIATNAEKIKPIVEGIVEVFGVLINIVTAIPAPIIQIAFLVGTIGPIVYGIVKAGSLAMKAFASWNSPLVTTDTWLTSILKKIRMIGKTGPSMNSLKISKIGTTAANAANAANAAPKIGRLGAGLSKISNSKAVKAIKSRASGLTSELAKSFPTLVKGFSKVGLGLTRFLSVVGGGLAAFVGGGLAALGASIGAAVVAFAPFIAIAAAIAVAGVLIVKAVNAHALAQKEKIQVEYEEIAARRMGVKSIKELTSAEQASIKEEAKARALLTQEAIYGSGIWGKFNSYAKANFPTMTALFASLASGIGTLVGAIGSSVGKMYGMWMDWNNIQIKAVEYVAKKLLPDTAAVGEIAQEKEKQDKMTMKRLFMDKDRSVNVQAKYEGEYSSKEKDFADAKASGKEGSAKSIKKEMDELADKILLEQKKQIRLQEILNNSKYQQIALDEGIKEAMEKVVEITEDQEKVLNRITFTTLDALDKRLQGIKAKFKSQSDIVDKINKSLGLSAKLYSEAFDIKGAEKDLKQQADNYQQIMDISEEELKMVRAIKNENYDTAMIKERMNKIDEQIKKSAGNESAVKRLKEQKEQYQEIIKLRKKADAGDTVAASKIPGSAQLMEASAKSNSLESAEKQRSVLLNLSKNASAGKEKYLDAQLGAAMAQIDAAKSFMGGLGLQVETLQYATSVLKEQDEVFANMQRTNAALADDAIAKIKKTTDEYNNLSKSQKELGKDNFTATILKQQAILNGLKAEDYELSQKRYRLDEKSGQLTKEMREGWLSAISSQHTAVGSFEKIIFTRDQRMSEMTSLNEKTYNGVLGGSTTKERARKLQEQDEEGGFTQFSTKLGEMKRLKEQKKKLKYLEGALGVPLTGKELMTAEEMMKKNGGAPLPNHVDIGTAAGYLPRDHGSLMEGANPMYQTENHVTINVYGEGEELIKKVKDAVSGAIHVEAKKQSSR